MKLESRRDPGDKTNWTPELLKTWSARISIYCPYSLSSQQHPFSILFSLLPLGLNFQMPSHVRLHVSRRTHSYKNFIYRLNTCPNLGIAKRMLKSCGHGFLERNANERVREHRFIPDDESWAELVSCMQPSM